MKHRTFIKETRRILSFYSHSGYCLEYPQIMKKKLRKYLVKKRPKAGLGGIVIK